MSLRGLRKGAAELEAEGRACIVYIPPHLATDAVCLAGYVPIADCTYGPKPMRGEIGRCSIFRFIQTKRVQEWVMHLERDEDGGEMATANGLNLFTTRFTQ